MQYVNLPRLSPHVRTALQVLWLLRYYCLISIHSAITIIISPGLMVYLPRSHHSFLLHLFISVCLGRVGVCHEVEVRGQYVGVSSLLPPQGPRDWTQVVRLGGKCLYPLPHLLTALILKRCLPSRCWSSMLLCADTLGLVGMDSLAFKHWVLLSCLPLGLSYCLFSQFLFSAWWSHPLCIALTKLLAVPGARGMLT